MNNLLYWASVLLTFVGLIHSLLGEILIFQKLRQDSIVPNLAMGPLKKRNIRILWATWHLASILGLGISTMLYKMAMADASNSIFLTEITITVGLSSFLVFYATHGKHPGWIGLLGVSILCWLH